MSRSEKLFRIKERLGLNQKDLAAMLRVHPSMLSHWKANIKESSRVEEYVNSLLRKAA